MSASSNRNPTGALTTALLCLMLLACSSPGRMQQLPGSQQMPGMVERRPATLQQPPAPDPQRAARFDAAQVERGRYLVRLLGCGSCHTDGALVGTPLAGRYLAGSDTGIAYSNPLQVKFPGVVYPANLTPDEETGLGGLEVAAVAQMIGGGLGRHGQTLSKVMPWRAYRSLTPEDASSIATYLLSLPAVRHAVPDTVAPGRRARSPFVYFSVYQSTR